MAGNVLWKAFVLFIIIRNKHPDNTLCKRLVGVVKPSSSVTLTLLLPHLPYSSTHAPPTPKRLRYIPNDTVWFTQAVRLNIWLMTVPSTPTPPSPLAKIGAMLTDLTRPPTPWYDWRRQVCPQQVVTAWWARCLPPPGCWILCVRTCLLISHPFIVGLFVCPRRSLHKSTGSRNLA